MFEYFESVKSKVSDAIDSVSDESFIDDLKKFADDGATSVSQFFSDENEVNGVARPKEGDDMLGYDLSSDEEDTVSDIPLIKKQYQRQHRPVIEEEERADSVGEMSGSGIRTGETRPGMPGYASLNAYVKPEEVLRRRITTSRKITEADLDKDNPLYRDMDQINNSEKYLEQRESMSNDSEDTVCSVCLMVPFYRLRHMLMN